MGVGTDDLPSLLACPMAGDVNVFLNQQYDDDEEDEASKPVIFGEMEVMIAEPSYRRQGLADEALRIIFHYITTRPTPGTHDCNESASALPLHPTQLMVRIGSENHPSLALFSRLGFSHFKDNTVFQETELRVRDDGALRCKPPLAVLEWEESA